MAVKPLQVHPAALEELKSAVAWYQERNQTAPLNFVAEVDRAINSITASPARWPTGEPRTRKLVLQRFPFAIIYRAKATVIQVLAIAHVPRRPRHCKRHL